MGVGHTGFLGMPYYGRRGEEEEERGEEERRGEGRGERRGGERRGEEGRAGEAGGGPESAAFTVRTDTRLWRVL